MKKRYPVFSLLLFCLSFFLCWLWFSLAYPPQLPTPTPVSAVSSPTATATQTAVSVTSTVAPSPTATERPSTTPTYTPLPTATNTAVPPTATPSPTATPAVYVVEFGDNLSDISEGLCGREWWRWLYRANSGRIRNPNLIFQGWALTIPWPCP